MSELANKRKNTLQRARRTRTNVRGTAERPRLSVVISNRHISVQIIDDSAHKTLVATTSLSVKGDKTMTEKAKIVGEDIAKRAKAAKIKKVVFDRGARKYHGRIKMLAETARENGLEF